MAGLPRAQLPPWQYLKTPILGLQNSFQLWDAHAFVGQSQRPKASLRHAPFPAPLSTQKGPSKKRQKRPMCDVDNFSKLHKQGPPRSLPGSIILDELVVLNHRQLGFGHAVECFADVDGRVPRMAKPDSMLVISGVRKGSARSGSSPLHVIVSMCQILKNSQHELVDQEKRAYGSRVSEFQKVSLP